MKLSDIKECNSSAELAKLSSHEYSCNYQVRQVLKAIDKLQEAQK